MAIFVLPQRYTFSILAVLGNIHILSGRNCLNLAIVEIVNESHNTTTIGIDNTEHGDLGGRKDEEFKVVWTEEDRASVLGAFFWGICLSEVNNCTSKCECWIKLS